MKALFTLLFSIFFVQITFAQTTGFPVEKKTAVVDNLTLGIKSDNTGLHTSSAVVLSNLIADSYLESSDASDAMIPLLMLLREGKTDEERIAAAVALYQLGNEIGIYRLKGVAIYDDNEKVAMVCKNLYYSYNKLHGKEYLLNF